MVIEGGKECFLQVAYYLHSPETIQREFGAFAPISDAAPDKIPQTLLGFYVILQKIAFCKMSYAASSTWQNLRQAADLHWILEVLVMDREKKSPEEKQRQRIERLERKVRRRSIKNHAFLLSFAPSAAIRRNLIDLCSFRIVI